MNAEARSQKSDLRSQCRKRTSQFLGFLPNLAGLREIEIEIISHVFVMSISVSMSMSMVGLSLSTPTVGLRCDRWFFVYSDPPRPLPLGSSLVPRPSSHPSGLFAAAALVVLRHVLRHIRGSSAPFSFAYFRFSPSPVARPTLRDPRSLFHSSRSCHRRLGRPNDATLRRPGPPKTCLGTHLTT